MSGLFGGNDQVAAPIAPPPPPSRSAAEVQTAALDTRRRLANRSGRSSTILTSGQGVTDEATPTTKTLLGSA